MTTRASSNETSLVAAVFIGALALFFASVPGRASAQEPIDVVLDFNGLTPGVVQTREYPLDVPVTARIEQAGFVRLTGVAAEIDWTIELCSTSSCEPVTDQSVGDRVAPGSYSLRVSALLAEGASGEGQAVGRVSLVAEGSDAGDGGVLAASGSGAVWWSLSIATGAIALGLFVMVASRRARSAS